MSATMAMKEARKLRVECDEAKALELYEEVRAASR